MIGITNAGVGLDEGKIDSKIEQFYHEHVENILSDAQTYTDANKGYAVATTTTNLAWNTEVRLGTISSAMTDSITLPTPVTTQTQEIRFTCVISGTGSLSFKAPSYYTLVWADETDGVEPTSWDAGIYEISFAVVVNPVWYYSILNAPGYIVAVRKLTELPTYKAFSLCTLSEINTICNNGYAQTLVDAGIWTLGDINNNVTYGDYSGIRLVHALTDTQRGANYYNTSGHIVVEFVNTIATSEWNADATTQTSYSASTLFSTLSDTIYNNLDTEFKNIIKTFAPATSVQNSSSSSAATTSVEHPSGYLHVANAVEVGSTNTYRPSENDYSFCFGYYSIDPTEIERRAKTGVITNWWLRSPSLYNESYYASFVNYRGIVLDDYINVGTSGIGVAPIAVI